MASVRSSRTALPTPALSLFVNGLKGGGQSPAIYALGHAEAFDTRADSI